MLVDEVQNLYTFFAGHSNHVLKKKVNQNGQKFEFIDHNPLNLLPFGLEFNEFQAVEH